MTSTTPVSTPVSTPVKGPAKTSYVILTRVSSRDPDATSYSAWGLESTVEAKSADAAIKKWADENGAGDGVELVAIPSRSWQPRTITVKTSTKVTLG